MQIRSCIKVILLSFITCGIYAVYNAALLHDETSKELGIEKKTVGLDVVFSYLTCGIWLVIIIYNIAKNHVEIAKRKEVAIVDYATVYLILAIMMGFIAIILLQNQQNELIRKIESANKDPFQK